MVIRYMRCSLSFIPPEKGGRSEAPYGGDGYAPYLTVPGDKRQYAIRLNGFPNDVKFEQELELEIELFYPEEYGYPDMAPGNKFFLWEGKKKIAAGCITSGIYTKEV